MATCEDKFHWVVRNREENALPNNEKREEKL